MMDILQSALGVKTNKCANISNPEIKTILNTDGTVSKSIIFLQLRYNVDNDLLSIENGENILYHRTDCFQFHHIYYLLYLHLDEYEGDIPLLRYLIYLSTYDTSLNSLPYIVYVLYYHCDFDSQITYKNLQYINIHHADYFDSRIHIKSPYLVFVEPERHMDICVVESRYLSPSIIRDPYPYVLIQYNKNE
jgi:hypothetical protein